MDGSRFDAMVRGVASVTRRSTLGALLATVFGWRSAAAGVVAETCLPNGQRCGRKAGGRGRPCKKCCSNHAPKQRGARHCACIPFGGKCGNSGQCCDGDCNNGTCGCLDDGETCQNDADCCFSSCIDGICQCLDDGEACEDDLDCCFSDCVQGVCQCLEDGEACDDSFDCCESNCVQGLCQCIEDGGTCSDDFDCCVSNCIDGICQCLEDGAECDDDFDCCNTPCTEGVCAFATCEVGNEVCTGGSEPDSPFCNSFACICLRSTSNAPFCGEINSATEECTGCATDDDCDAVTGPGSACVDAVDCCDIQGDEPETLCLAPCPDADTPLRATGNAHKTPDRRAEQRQRRRRHKHERKKRR